MKKQIDNTMKESKDDLKHFTLKEVQDAIKLLKPGKATGLDHNRDGPTHWGKNQDMNQGRR